MEKEIFMVTVWRLYCFLCRHYEWQNMQNRMAFGELSATEEELFADETMIESLFIEDSEFDDWFEERYVLNVVN